MTAVLQPQVHLAMGNIFLRPAPAYEAREVGELATRVVASLGKQQRVGDIEKVIRASCASKEKTGSCRS
jgi:hypothetical protein